MYLVPAETTVGADQSGDERSEGNVRRLSDAVRRVRIAEAERSDAVDDLHEAERARLAMLSDELEIVVSELPEGDDYFVCRVSGNAPPRFWVDPTSHVVIGRDRRTYRFLKDTRLGRVVIGETAELARMADMVTDYVAERIVERDRAIETDRLMGRLRDAAVPRSSRLPRDLSAASAAGGHDRGSSFTVWLLISFLIGIAIGALGLIGYAWYAVPPPG
jgi:hypothetical protein